MCYRAPNAVHHCAIAGDPRNLSRQSGDSFWRNYSLLASSALGPLRVTAVTRPNAWNSHETRLLVLGKQSTGGKGYTRSRRALDRKRDFELPRRPIFVILGR